ncbi:type IX secretion system sortase PorU [Sediminibacterium soli]|uniref:type IX secretion system sortase PorU n=1 Tax=Sediminibacterium soli TaxID=2698829 RepID=UPI00137A266F|nr:type IX secretion system sortase PorU [Sediminibacterium soli]
MPHSALASGNWYKIAVTGEGVYRIDVSFLNSLGINTSGLNSANLRLFGNGGAILPESNAASRTDDLSENAIEVMDGGDGLFNGQDYLLFYAAGPHIWLKDSTRQGFRHRKNLYSDTAYYFLTTDGQGKRVRPQSSPANATVTVSSFDERYYHENELTNFLHSGKEWYGEEFSNNPGGTLSRSFSVDWPGLQVNEPVKLVTSLAARSVGGAGSFLVKLNNQTAQSVGLPSVTGYYLDPYAQTQTAASGVLAAQSKLDIGITWSSAAAGAKGWLNWFEVSGRRALAINGTAPLFFRDWRSVSAQTGVFIINNASPALVVWDITRAAEPEKMQTTVSGTQLQFANDLSRLREYAVFTPASLPQPVAIGKIGNQDLHNSAAADLLIITGNGLVSEAQRLAAFHRQKNNYSVVVATTEQIANEFGSGTADPSALRDFVKMYYDKATRSGTKKTAWLLLFGTASYQYRPGDPASRSLVPGYESDQSLDPLNTYTSDDFFGLLDDNDDITRNDPAMQLDIGIGRIPARTLAEAKTMVDKIIRYHAKQSLGAWRNQVVYVADDGDRNLHLQDAESVSATAATANPVYNPYKIYLDAYPVAAGSGGARYPAVNDAIVSQLFNGALIFNYSGHGSYQRLAEEAVFTQTELNRLNNADRLPLFVTASCDFAPHDDPALNSLGSGVLMGGSNGAIALLTTTRVVFAYSNRQINDNYLKLALRQGADGKYPALGQCLQQAKNLTMQTTGDVINNRKFTLLGDPAMQLGFPELGLRLMKMNDRPIGGTDTLQAMGKYRFDGEVTDISGNRVPGFSGRLTATVFDKPQQVKTLGNDAASPVTTFTQQAGILYKGDVTVTDGKFRFEFIMPKDINYQVGTGRISLYADDGVRAANGVDTSFRVGGTGSRFVVDTKGPDIQAFINDDRFRDGGLANENPVLLLKLFDSSGISISGYGIGHDITAVIDGNERNVLVLNHYYTADTDSYQSGRLSYQLPLLEEGQHTIRIKAWDVANNSSEVSIRFWVARQEKLQVSNVRNFPNPFAGSTTFGFEHNQPNTDLDVSIGIYTASGSLVKQIRQVVNTSGSRNCEINWGGDNTAGAKLPKGIYIYRVAVKARGQQQTISGQLIIL